MFHMPFMYCAPVRVKETVTGGGIYPSAAGIITMKDVRKKKIRRNVFLDLIWISPLTLHS